MVKKYCVFPLKKKKIVIVKKKKKSLWYNRIKTLLDVLLSENNPLLCGNSIVWSDTALAWIIFL